MPRTPRRPRVTPPAHTQRPDGHAPIDLARLESLALAGTPENEIAAYFGVSMEALQPYQEVIARDRLRGRTLVRRKAHQRGIIDGDRSMLILLARERCGFQHHDLVREKLQAELEEKKLRVELCKLAIEEQKIVLEQRQLGVQLQRLELQDRQRKQRVDESAEENAELERLDSDALDARLHWVRCQLIRTIENPDELDAVEKRIHTRRLEEDEAIRSCRAEILRPTPSAGQPEH